jgi:intracellular sulfur oxidation DsrE/DsrF family protein
MKIMNIFRCSALAVLVAAAPFYFEVNSSAAAQETSASAPASKRVHRKTTTRSQLKRKAEPKQLARVTPAPAQEPDKVHHLAVQVNVNDPAAMNLALNNVSNVIEYYRSRLEEVQVEVVAYGPGLHMFRDDTSPVKERIKAISQSTGNVAFMACGNTQQNMQKAESKEIPLISQAKITESGVVRLMELQEKGWSYIRP